MIRRPKRLLQYFLLLALLLSPVFVCETKAQGGGSASLNLSPSSGPMRTSVQVTLNVTQWLSDSGQTGNVDMYRGSFTWNIVWDAGGWSGIPADLETIRSSKPYWTIIGTTRISYDGLLNATVMVPQGIYATAGEHFIYAINSNTESAYSYWWGSFEVMPGGVASQETVSFSVSWKPHDTTVLVNGTGLEEGMTADAHHSARYPYGDTVVVQASLNDVNLVLDDIVITDSGGSRSNPGDTATIHLLYDTSVEVKAAEKVRNPEGVCIIATATYGGPMAPEVVFMRSVRDDMIGSNNVGKVLVDGWNRFYYSWSPPVAAAIAGSSALKVVFSVALLPLLGTMHMVAYQYNLLASVNPVFASVSSFITAVVLSILIYIALPTWGLLTLYKHKRQGMSLSSLFFRGKTKR